MCPAAYGRRGANDAVVRPDDRVPSLECFQWGQHTKLACSGLERRPLALDRQRRRAAQPFVCTLDALCFPLECDPWSRAETLLRALEALRVPFERTLSVPRERNARAVEVAEQLRELRADELAGHRGSRRPDVASEIAQRRILFVSDGRHHRYRRGRDRADESLVAEREQVFEASAAAGEHDDVDVRLRR